MELSSIVEALLTASDEPMPAEEIARLIRARVAEAEDARARKIEDGETPEELPDWLVGLAAVSSDQVIAGIAALNHIYEASGHGFNNEGGPGYDKDDAELARARTLDLFEQNGAL